MMKRLIFIYPRMTLKLNLTGPMQRRQIGQNSYDGIPSIRKDSLSSTGNFGKYLFDTVIHPVLEKVLTGGVGACLHSIDVKDSV